MKVKKGKKKPKHFPKKLFMTALVSSFKKATYHQQNRTLILTWSIANKIIRRIWKTLAVLGANHLKNHGLLLHAAVSAGLMEENSQMPEVWYHCFWNSWVVQKKTISAIDRTWLEHYNMLPCSWGNLKTSIMIIFMQYMWKLTYANGSLRKISCSNENY